MAKDLCIIGNEKSDSNIRLLEEAKKSFDSVFFVPINGIGIGLTDTFSIAYRATNLLKFPAVFARIPQSFCSYAYQLLSLFPQQTFMPVKPISFLLTDERFFLLTVLRKRGIPTTNMRLARSKKAAENILNAEYPFIIRTPDKKTGVIVENTLEAKSIIDTLTSLNKSVLIEDVVKDMISVYVASPNVIASVRKKTKERDVVFGHGVYKNIRIGIDIERLALEAATAIETGICRVDISMDNEPKVVNINLNPGVVAPGNVAGVNIPEKIICAIAEGFESHLKKPLLVKFFEDANSVMKDVLKAKHLL